ncbi:MAG: sulfatase-like hydrolase/transferase [Cellvibrio sp.]|uniref:sulfatase-like hydrolase/transferase n=1 Tax=Cellvibrio sp. TaxID=1965322 RepID=UPI0031AB4469
MNRIDHSRRSFISRIPKVSAASLAATGLLGGKWAYAKTAVKPNIIFILADDLGYADLSVYGQRHFETPHLDKLAKQGVRFTQAYANSAVCSATRFGLITGRYQYRLRGGLEEPLSSSNNNIGLPVDHPTLPSLLKKQGYKTALFGKWHLGSLPTFGPLKSGYDTFFGNYGGALDYFTHKTNVGPDAKEGLFEGEVPVEKVGYYTDLIADRAVDYIKTHDKKNPFLLSLHFTAPHWPWEGPEDEAVAQEIKSLFHYEGGSLETYAKMVKSLDEAVGRVLKTLDANGLAKNTIVIFTSDNGGERFSDTWPFTGQKTELLEGGIRVPAIVRWPAAIKSGQVSEQVAITMDWLPTLLSAAEGAPDPAYPSDGENLLPILFGAQPVKPRTLFWRYKGNNQRAIRSGDWKYLKIANNEFLFNLAEDVRERANYAERNPEKFNELKQQWESWNKTMLVIPQEANTHVVDGTLQADRHGVISTKK